VSVLPSVESLEALRASARTSSATRPMTGFGDLPERPYTAGELKAVAEKLGAPASDIHLGQEASETAVKSARLSDYRVVYFATNCLVPGDIKDMAEPAVVLSLPKTSTALDDGLLTASEVAQLKLNADLVVLSCNGRAGGELARALFYAGARALLVSHWKVSSTAVTRLTTATFDYLKSNPSVGPAEALRRAMLAYMADTSDPDNGYPAFWAPFEVAGDGAARK
jgi:CHAT domain-containing protein